MSDTELNRYNKNFSKDSFNTAVSFSSSPSPSQTSTEFQDYLWSLPDWKDDQRVLSLFSSFKGTEEDAPESWHYKLNFWKSLIIKSVPQKWIGNNDIFVFRQSDLKNYFYRHGSSPLGLHIVIKDMLRKREISLLTDYLTLSSSSSTYSLISSTQSQVSNYLKKLVWSSFSWMGNTIYSTFIDDVEDAPADDLTFNKSISKNGNSEFILPSLVDIFISNLLTFCRNNLNDFVDCCLSYHDIRSISDKICLSLGWKTLSEKDITIIIHYLNTHQTDLIYFDSPGNQLSNVIESKVFFFQKQKKDQRKSVLETLSSIVKIKETINRLENHLSFLDNQILNLQIKARQSLQKNKNVAIQTLKRKKIIENYQSSLSLSLLNLDTIMSSIRSAKNDEEILHAYQNGTKSLKAILDQKHLSVEAIDETMETLVDCLEKQREIDNAIILNNEVIGSLTLEEESSLEKELDELLIKATPLASLPSLEGEKLTATLEKNLEYPSDSLPENVATAESERDKDVSGLLEELNDLQISPSINLAAVKESKYRVKESVLQ